MMRATQGRSVVVIVLEVWQGRSHASSNYCNTTLCWALPLVAAASAWSAALS